MDDPMPIKGTLAIPLSEIQLRASRSSGPGGQHANVTASRIEAVLEIDVSPTLSAEHKRILGARYGRRITATAQETRGQARNREIALQRLQERIRSGLRRRKPRRATRPSRGAKQRRLEAKRRNSERKQRRRRPDLD